jgi:diguanylate cyclase (GGDEF)-like protein/PAS domain S-box-containing protein
MRRVAQAPLLGPRRRSRTAVHVAVVVGLALSVVHVLAPAGPVRDWSYLAVGIGASAMAWRGALHSAQRRVAHLIALTVTLTTLGDVTFQVIVWITGRAPEVSVADIGWVGCYAALCMALGLVLRSAPGVRLDLEAWVDVAAVSVVALLVQWQIGLGELVSDAAVAPTVRFVWSLYPAFDAVLLALVLRALLARRLRTRAALYLGGGATCWLVSDLIYTVFAPEGSVATWVDSGWLVGAILLSLAASERRSMTPPEGIDAPPARARSDAGRALVGLLPLALPSGIELVGYARGKDPDPLPLAGTTVVLIGLAIVRMVLLMRSDRGARERLRSQEQYSRALAANSSDAVAVVDATGTVRNDATALALLMGYQGTTLEGVDLFTTVDPEDLDAAQAMLERSLQNPGRPFEIELRALRADGRSMWVGARVVNLLDDRDLRGIVVTVHDITRRKSAELELEHQAFHDGLTGLANRALFADRVEQALERSARPGLQPAVIYLDLDGFKTVNDSLGHGAGDDLLREVAQRLTSAVRAGETVARLGGDEFAVLIEPCRRPLDDAAMAAERILQVLSTPVELGEQTVRVSASLGIAAGSIDSDAASLLRDADVAMYRAKSAGKGQWVVYRSEMRTAAVERLQLETDLIHALDAGQFVLVYQPVVELRTEQVVGFEALIRWHHPTLGVVLPDSFIPLAEESGLILAIGAWVLDEACQTTARWLRDYPHSAGLSMAVNVSARQLGSEDLVGQVERALARSGLDPANLVIEMTETALVQDPSIAAARLHRLRALGLRLAIDDFGTGYSSLSYLRQFPVDILKIDRSFINAITSREKVPAIVRGLLELGRTLELETIAEGVEYEVQRDRLREERCDLAQGFLFARPLDEAEAELLLMRLEPAGPLGEGPFTPG